MASLMKQCALITPLCIKDSLLYEYRFLWYIVTVYFLFFIA